MRVIAGEAKGRRLRYPRGGSLRPSSELVRNAIFSMLDSAGADMSRVLDLYAGTGAFGIEALSRGAGWVDFVEQDARHARVIKENLSTTGFVERATVYRKSVEDILEFLEGTYGVVFMDPPYANEKLVEAVSRVAESPLVSKNTLIVVEHSSRWVLESRYGSFELYKTRRYGDTAISIYAQEVHS